MTVLKEEVPANFVPAAAVIRRGRALSIMIGRKVSVGGTWWWFVKSPGFTGARRSRHLGLSEKDDHGISHVGVVSKHMGRNTKGEDNDRVLVTDAEGRKRGEQTGLETLVVHAVNYECYH